MPLSRFISDLDALIAEFKNDAPTNALAFDDLRLAVARLNEIRRQVDIAYQKLGPIISLAEMDVIHNRVDFSASERELEDRFLIHDHCVSGHTQMDEEHRELMALGNRVFAVACGSSANAANVQDAVGDFASNALEHFRNEEALMAAHNFPEAVQHRSVHERMLEYIEEMRELALAQPLAVAIKIEKFLGSWFIWHMQRDDVELARHLQATVAPQTT